jgi:Flp pilus assembly protein TadD
LTPQGEARLARALPVDPRAHEAYLKGRWYWNQRPTESLTRAIALFQQSADIDAGYAPAYAGLAGSLFLLSSTEIAARPPHDVVPKAKAAAVKALELDESLAEAHATLAYALLQYDWDWPSADREFRRAIELDPNYATAHFWYAVCQAAAGRFQHAIEEALRAQQLDPVAPIINAGVSWMHHYARRDDDAIVHARLALDLSPDFPIGLMRLGVAFKRKGMYDDAIRTLRQAISGSANSAGTLAQLGATYAAAGKTGDANAMLERLKEMSRKGSAVAHPIALVYSAFGAPSGRSHGSIGRTTNTRGRWHS